MVSVVPTAKMPCATSLRCVRRINVRAMVCASGAAKKQRMKKRRLDNAVAGTSTIQSFLVTTTAGEGGGNSSGGTSTTWTGSSGAKTINNNTYSTQNKSQTHRAKQYEVTSFLSTDCELSTETCSKNVYILGPRS